MVQKYKRSCAQGQRHQAQPEFGMPGEQGAQGNDDKRKQQTMLAPVTLRSCGHLVLGDCYVLHGFLG